MVAVLGLGRSLRVGYSLGVLEWQRLVARDGVHVGHVGRQVEGLRLKILVFAFVVEDGVLLALLPSEVAGELSGCLAAVALDADLAVGHDGAAACAASS